VGSLSHHLRCRLAQSHLFLTVQQAMVFLACWKRFVGSAGQRTRQSVHASRSSNGLQRDGHTMSRFNSDIRTLLLGQSGRNQIAECPIIAQGVAHFAMSCAFPAGVPARVASRLIPPDPPSALPLNPSLPAHHPHPPRGFFVAVPKFGRNGGPLWLSGRYALSNCIPLHRPSWDPGRISKTPAARVRTSLPSDLSS